VLGYTLNILTLLALSLVVGILVDDAIVEVENIVRHLRMGKKPKEAAMDAAIEIGLAVVATTLTICAVFIPVAFMSGIAGEFFGPFSFTVVVAVLCSLLVARTLTPMMAAYFLKPHDRPEQPARIMTWYLERVRWWLDARPRSVPVDGFLAGRQQRLHDALRRARAGRIAKGHTGRRRSRAHDARDPARGSQRLYDGR
jgi:multidrug efflux pump subunit AcrB